MEMVIMNDSKTCKKCGEEKPLGEFYNQKSTKDGKRPRCKLCTDEYTNEYNKKNREKITAKSKENRLKNPEQYQEQKDRQKAKHQDRMENDPEYAEMAREKNRVIQRRWKSNPTNRVIANLRNRLVDCITKGTKSASTKTLIGCHQEELMNHIEENWEKGMSWENYGEWHIDHIRPVKSFDMTDPQQQRDCFHWTNLQPLWAMDNFKKQAKWDGE